MIIEVTGNEEFLYLGGEWGGAGTPRTEDMMPIHGLELTWLGRLTRSFGKGGSRGASLTGTEAFFGGIFGLDDCWPNACKDVNR